jgi:microcystin-dependent protein
MDPFIGEITMVGFNYAPVGWAFCDGSLLPIQQYQALFSLIGTTYGGDGQTTFALPNLRGRVPIHAGQGAGLSSRALGTTGGEENVTLQPSQLPAHTHPLVANQAAATTTSLKDAQPFQSPQPIYGTGTPVKLNAQSITPSITSAGGGNQQAHENRQPYLVLNFIIALEGVYPSRP